MNNFVFDRILQNGSRRERI